MSRLAAQIQQWEALYNNGKRIRIHAPHIEGAFAEAWARAPNDAGAVEIYGITLCGIAVGPFADPSAAIAAEGGS